MIRLADIERRIASMDELLEIVTALRTLAGVRMQDAQKALPGVRSYAGTVACAIADILVLGGDPGAATSVAAGRTTVVACVAEHGFVGGFNDRLAAELSRRACDALLVLGSRGAAALAEHGRPADWVHAMPTQAAGVPDAVSRLAGELYRRLAAGTVERVEVVHARQRTGGREEVVRFTLLPFDPGMVPRSTRRQPPLHSLPAATLRDRLIEEYVFALLAEAAVESLAAENAARFATMESARDNLGRSLSDLGREARTARQAEITEELLELSTGAAASAARG